MKPTKLAQILISALLLTPLSFVAQPAFTEVSDEMLSRRVAFALNTTPAKVAISDRHVNGVRLDFTVTHDNRTLQCYVTAIGGTLSDAICAGTDGQPAQCDALSKAAGRC